MAELVEFEVSATLIWQITECPAIVDREGVGDDDSGHYSLPIGAGQ